MSSEIWLSMWTAKPTSQLQEQTTCLLYIIILIKIVLQTQWLAKKDIYHDSEGSVLPPKCNTLLERNISATFNLWKLRQIKLEPCLTQKSSTFRSKFSWLLITVCCLHTVQIQGKWGFLSLIFKKKKIIQQWKTKLKLCDHGMALTSGCRTVHAHKKKLYKLHKIIIIF